MHAHTQTCLTTEQLKHKIQSTKMCIILYIMNGGQMTRHALNDSSLGHTCDTNVRRESHNLFKYRLIFKVFFCFTVPKICNQAITKCSTSSRMCRYTAL